MQLFICQRCTVLWACVHIKLCICYFRYGKDMKQMYSYQLFIIEAKEEQFFAVLGRKCRKIFYIVSPPIRFAHSSHRVRGDVYVFHRR